MQHQHNVDNPDHHLIFSLSPPFDISPTSASADLDSMLPRPSSLPHSTSISSDSMLEFVQRAHPSLDLYKSNQTAGPLQRSEQSTPRFSVEPTTRRPICSIQKEMNLSWHSVAIDGLRGLGTNPDTGLVTNTQHIHPLESSHKPNLGAGESAFQRYDLPNTGAGENSDEGEQAEVRVGPMTTDCKLDSSVVRRETMIRKQKSKSMIQGKEITISGGKLTNVGGDYHEHNITYVIDEASTCREYLDTIPDMLKKLDDKLNGLLNSSPKEDTTKGDDGSRQTMRSLSRVENENMGDTSSSNDVTEIQFNSLNDPPRPTSVFDDGYCIHQTPTPSKINDFAPNSRTSSVMDQAGCNSPSGNQYPYPFGYLPVLVAGIVHYSPYWLSSWGGWIASWISWISSWMWSSFF